MSNTMKSNVKSNEVIEIEIAMTRKQEDDILSYALEELSKKNGGKAIIKDWKLVLRGTLEQQDYSVTL